jgi:hypothetical protein
VEDFNCAVCDNIVKPDDFGMCEVCEWMADPVQEDDPDYQGGANEESLNEAITAWKNKKTPS